MQQECARRCLHIAIALRTRGRSRSRRLYSWINQNLTVLRGWSGYIYESSHMGLMRNRAPRCICARRIHALESANRDVVIPLRSQRAARHRPQVQPHTPRKKHQYSGHVGAATERTSSSACERPAVGNTTGCPESYASSEKKVPCGEKRGTYLATNSIQTVDQRVPVAFRLLWSQGALVREPVCALVPFLASVSFDILEVHLGYMWLA